MKKIICLLTALVMALALAACSGGDKDVTDAPEDPTEAPTEADPTVLSEGLDDNGYIKGVRALDYVTLPDYRNMDLPDFTKLTDRAIEDGDFVNIDYVGSIDGVAFQGGSTQGAGTDVIIGVTSYIDDFLEQLIGHKPGENFDIEVTFPENYGSEELNGKDAVFNITVNYIWNVTEENATALGFTDRNTMAQYVAYNGESMAELTQNMGVNVVLTASVCETIPDAAYDATYTQVKTLLSAQAARYGMDADTFAQLYYGAASAEDYLASRTPMEAKWHLVFQAISEQENILVTDEDIEEAGYADYVELYDRPYVAYNLLQEMITEFLEELMG